MFSFRSIFRQYKPIRVAYVSSYIPRRCGIATYTKDLTNAINLLNPTHLAEIVALNNSADTFAYPWEVKQTISEDEISNYVAAAQRINQSGVELVSLQHEFGLHGGAAGEHILHFIKELRVPLVTTFHTVVDDPTSAYGRVLRSVADRSDAIVVMMSYAAKKLHKHYGVPTSKIVVIPHGVPDLPFNETDRFKRKHRLPGRLILGNINLLSPNKGIEYALEAVALIARSHPEVLYMIIGQTHPTLLRTQGERYRQSLQARVRTLGIKRNVRFVNSYLTLEDLIDWLKTFDFYVTPYLNPEQVTSGALAYAIGAGKACVSTPYIYAKEVLAEGRGVIVPFRDASAIAETVLTLAHEPDKKKEIETKSYQYGRLMTWPNVAQRHLTLFRKIKHSWQAPV